MFTVTRDFGELKAGQPFDLRGFEGFEWFREYAAKRHKMVDLQRKPYDEGYKWAVESMAVVDPVASYFDDVAAAAGGAAHAATATDRLETFFIRHGGAVDTPLTRGVSTAFFKSAVKTVYEPAAKTNLVWVLMGAQGLGKTQVLDALAPWAELVGQISPKEISGGSGSDAGRKPAQTAERCLLIEVPELKLRGNYVEDWKGFISNFAPVERLPYLHEPRRLPRRGVLVATTNNRDLLRDPTGNRRFPIIELTRMIDLAAVRQERDALWAAAVRLYRQDPDNCGIPESLWAAAAEQAEEYKLSDLLEDHVRGLTEGTLPWPVVTGASDDVAYTQVVGLRPEWAPHNDTPKVLATAQWQQITKCKSDSRLSAALRACGWTLVRTRAVFANGRESRVWVHPEFKHILER